MVETVGRAIPCFRHGTDYILNLLENRSFGVLCGTYIYLNLSGRVSHPSTTLQAAYKSIHGCWIAPHTARHCLIACFSDLGFTDKAEFSLVCCHTRRLITNRTHVQKYRHLSFYECSRHIRDSPQHLPIDRRPSG